MTLRVLIGLALALALAGCSDDTTGPDAAPGKDAGVSADKAAPKPDKAAPKPDKAAPKPDKAAPKPDKAAPKPDKAAPKPDKALPQTDLSALSCTAIRSAYMTNIKVGKKCSPMLPVVQCTTVKLEDIACYCKTSINNTNTAILAAIKVLETQWAAQKCATAKPWNCPKKPCKSITKGQCVNGTCQP